VKWGDGAKCVVVDSAPGWAHYEAQHTLRNDGKHHWSMQDGSLDDECVVEVPRSNSPPVGQGWRGEEVAVKTQRDLELVDVKEMGVVFDKLRYEDELDAFAPSLRMKWLDLENKSKTVSNRRVAPTAPPPAAQRSCLPVLQDPTHSQMHNDSPHGPLAAVSSIQPRFHEESCRHSLWGVKLGQINVGRCSVNEKVSK
jgi:hypothetical protein